LSLVGLGIFSFGNLDLGGDSWDSGQKFQKKFEAPIHPPLVTISGPSGGRLVRWWDGHMRFRGAGSGGQVKSGWGCFGHGGGSSSRWGREEKKVVPQVS
jgi:hypothetical protein